VVNLKIGTLYASGKSSLYPLETLRVTEIQSGRLKLFPQRKYYVAFEAFLAMAMKNPYCVGFGAFMSD
jgi:hypothetical protein